MTVSYSIQINRVPQDSFKPTRGIRQGNPLSLYLFILCAETLSCLLHRAVSSNSISNIPIGKTPIQVNHLFFTNDSLLFCKANSIELCNMLHVLERYERAFGQALNKDKQSSF